jgi:hypothetical protein
MLRRALQFGARFGQLVRKGASTRLGGPSLAVLLVFLFLGLTSSHPASAHWADEVPVDIAELTRRLTQWRESFVNLRVVYELRSLPQSKRPIESWEAAPEVDSGTPFSRDEWIWADHGLDLFETTSIVQEGASARMTEVFNAPKGFVFRATYNSRPNESETLYQLSLDNVRTGKARSLLSRTALKGIYWPGTAHWLNELLLAWRWTVEGVEDVAGERCARIVAAQPEVSDAKWLEYLWLDLKHDCQVRRHRSPPIPGRRNGTDFVVDELQRLPNGIWFPKRGRIQLQDFQTPEILNQSWEVLECTVNGPLDHSRFDPPVPGDPTIVVDARRGHWPGIGKVSVPQDGSPVGPAGNPPSDVVQARAPRNEMWWSVALALASLGFLGAALWRRVRGKENSP